MIRQPRLIVLLLFALFLFESASAQVNKNIYVDRRHEFSIAFPSGWEIKKSQNPETVIKAVYRDPQGRLAYIAIAAYELPKAFDFSTVTADDMFKVLLEELPDIEIARLDHGETKIRSNRALFNTIDIKSPPQASMLSKHFHLAKNGKLYRITAATDRDAQFFRDQLVIMEESIHTFAFGL
jgi:hypothetical protein